MDPLLLNIMFFVLISGGIILIIFSIMAFCNVESMELKEGKNVNSGIILLIDALIYGGLGIFCKWKSHNLSVKKEDRDNFIEMQSMNIN